LRAPFAPRLRRSISPANLQSGLAAAVRQPWGTTYQPHVRQLVFIGNHESIDGALQHRCGAVKRRTIMDVDITSHTLSHRLLLRAEDSRKEYRCKRSPFFLRPKPDPNTYR
jgi:hypothetical protein